MLVDLLILVLAALLVFHIYRAMKYTIIEGAENYDDYDENDEKSCMSLATQNEKNIQWLEDQIDNVTSVGNQLSGLQGTADNNTSTLKSLLDQQSTVPGVDTDDNDTT